MVIYMSNTQATARPNLTADVVDQLRAFGTGDIFPVVIVKDIKSKCGNVLIGKGAESWGMHVEADRFMPAGYITVWTGHTHYAGCKSSSINAKSVRIQSVAA